MKKLSGLLIVLAILLPPVVANAERAKIMLLPTRVVMENNDRYTTVIIRNIGDATGDITVGLIDMEMQENGKVLEMGEGQSDPYSAIPHLRIAPRSMTLKPEDTQPVRIMLRKPSDLPAGEYRSHLKIKIENDNVEATEAKNEGENKESTISVKAKLAFTIPVIFRTGETTVSVKIDSPKLRQDAQGTPILDMALLHEGTRSVMGDFNIMQSVAGEAPQIIKTFPGIPVYRSTARRQVEIPLSDLPAGTDLSKGKLIISYTAQEKEGGMKLAEEELDLSVH